MAEQRIPPHSPEIEDLHSYECAVEDDLECTSLDRTIDRIGMGASQFLMAVLFLSLNLTPGLNA